MLISDSHEFIFLQMRKVASTSMAEILRPLAITAPNGRLAHLKSRTRLEWNYQRHHFRLHEDILAVKRRMPSERFERYFKFAFVRNPWERLVSEYEYILTQPEPGRHKRIRRLDGFIDFIRLQIKRTDSFQFNMLYDNNNNLLVDYIGKFETLEQDWKTVCERIGIPCSPLPSKNVTRHKPVQDYFDHDSIALVAKHWAREIKLFDYSFESLAHIPQSYREPQTPQ